MTLQVKYGLIRLVNQRLDLCEQVSNVDLDCPVKKGKMTIVKDVDLPKEIPPVRVVPLLLWVMADLLIRENITFSRMRIRPMIRRLYAWRRR